MAICARRVGVPGGLPGRRTFGDEPERLRGDTARDGPWPGETSFVEVEGRVGPDGVDGLRRTFEEVLS